MEEKHIMKKLFVAALLSIASMGMVACGGEEAPATPAAPRKGYFITGDKALKVNGKTAEESGGGTWGYGGDAFELKEITLAQAKEIDAEVGAKLEADNRVVKNIYSISGVEVGVGDVGWTSKFVKDEALWLANGSYCLKIIECTYSNELKKMTTTQWTPNPVTGGAAHVENLKNYFCPSWQEEADEYGLSWADNPVVSAGAGIYTVIFAVYKDVATKDTFNYGTAFIKTEDKEGQEYEEVTEWIPEDHDYGLIGIHLGTEDWGNDFAALAEADGKWGGIFDFAADDEFKVRADGDWTNSWGTECVVNQEEMKDNFDFSGGNIKVKVAGSYGVAIEFVEGVAQITLGIPNEE